MSTDEGTEASENNDPDEAGKTSPDDSEGYGDTHGEADGGVVVHDTLSLGGLEFNSFEVRAGDMRSSADLFNT